jgi:hypothetical protein
LRLPGDFDAQPRWAIETLELVSKLYLGDDGIGAGEHVHLPQMPSPGCREARLLNQAAGAKRQQRLRVEHRDGILNIEAAQLGAL